MLAHPSAFEKRFIFPNQRFWKSSKKSCRDGHFRDGLRTAARLTVPADRNGNGNRFILVCCNCGHFLISTNIDHAMTTSADMPTSSAFATLDLDWSHNGWYGSPENCQLLWSTFADSYQQYSVLIAYGRSNTKTRHNTIFLSDNRKHEFHLEISKHFWYIMWIRLAKRKLHVFHAVTVYPGPAIRWAWTLPYSLLTTKMTVLPISASWKRTDQYIRLCYSSVP